MTGITQITLSEREASSTPIEATNPTLKHAERLTFGVELEMTIAGLYPEHSNPHPQDSRPVRGIFGKRRTEGDDGFEVLEHVAQILTAAGVCAEAQPHVTVVKDWRPQNVSAWVVIYDHSIKHPPSSDNESSDLYVYHGIELISPVFFYSTAALNRIKKVSRIMSKHFRINLNPSTGLHVHVGNRASGFELSTVRNLLATIFTFEPQIEEIHPRFRHNNLEYCSNLRNGSHLKKIVGKPFWESALNYLLTKVDNMMDLYDATVPEHDDMKRGAYNIHNLYRATNSYPGLKTETKKTVEFRQHEGSIDPNAVANWARFCVGLVEFAESRDSKTMKTFLDDYIHIHKDDLSIMQITEDLGMPDIAQYYTDCVQDNRNEHALSLENAGSRGPPKRPKRKSKQQT
jgi:hypothetical protein